MDSGKEYLEARLKENGVKQLTDKQKDEFNNEISSNKRKIESLQKRINDLEIPSIPKAKYLHDKGEFTEPCGLRAAIFYGSNAEMIDKEFYCLFCETRFYSYQ
ncbi:MAG: hypothetical protein AABW56_00940 [Nanoarchaeota archaeon]